MDFGEAMPSLAPKCKGGLARAAGKPWSHLRLLLDRVKDPGARDWYLAVAVREGWSREALGHMIEGQLHMSPENCQAEGANHLIHSREADDGRPVSRCPEKFTKTRFLVFITRKCGASVGYHTQGTCLKTGLLRRTGQTNTSEYSAATNLFPWHYTCFRIGTEVWPTAECNYIFRPGPAETIAKDSGGPGLTAESLLTNSRACKVRVVFLRLG
jgi:hypothetical protein